MEKKVWVRPQGMTEKFQANETVSACVESKDTYYFKCDAGNPDIGYNNWVYVFYSGNQASTEVTSNYGRATSSYKPCGSTHEVNADDKLNFVRGFIDTDKNKEYNVGDIDCIVWLVDGKNCFGEDTIENIHCCTNLNVNSYSKNLS